jgi:hypothetical protein
MAMFRAFVGFVAALLAFGVGTARAADVMLYEISEAVKLDANAGGKFKSNATLFGFAEAGTALCPQWVVDALDKTDSPHKVCGITVQALGKADDTTGIGPVSGTLSILVQDKNATDAPEITVLTGKLSGTIDMSPAFQQARPVGSITGSFSIQGSNNSIAKNYSTSGNFTGKFRLPFVTDDVSTPQYMMDDGSTVTINPSEYVLRYPAVRLEVTLTAPTIKK